MFDEIDFDEIIKYARPSGYFPAGTCICIVYSYNLMCLLNKSGYLWNAGNKIFEYGGDFINGKYFIRIYINKKIIIFGTIKGTEEKIYRIINMCDNCGTKMKGILAIDNYIEYCPKCRK